MIREEKGQSETVVLFFDFFEGGHHLEIKINREIREYTEAMYFGLSPVSLSVRLWPAALLWGFIFCSARIWEWKRSVRYVCWERRPLRPLLQKKIVYRNPIKKKI